MTLKPFLVSIATLVMMTGCASVPTEEPSAGKSLTVQDQAWIKFHEWQQAIKLTTMTPHSNAVEMYSASVPDELFAMSSQKINSQVAKEQCGGQSVTGSELKQTFSDFLMITGVSSQKKSSARFIRVKAAQIYLYFIEDMGVMHWKDAFGSETSLSDLYVPYFYYHLANSNFKWSVRSCEFLREMQSVVLEDKVMLHVDNHGHASSLLKKLKKRALRKSVMNNVISANVIKDTLTLNIYELHDSPLWSDAEPVFEFTGEDNFTYSVACRRHPKYQVAIENIPQSEDIRENLSQSFAMLKKSGEVPARIGFGDFEYFVKKSPYAVLSAGVNFEIIPPEYAFVWSTDIETLINTGSGYTSITCSIPMAFID